MCGVRTRPPTDVDPPRVKLPSAGAYRLAAPGALTCVTRTSVDVVIGIAVVVIAVVSCNDIVNVIVAGVGIVDATVIVVVIVICSVIVVVVVVV